MRWSVAHIKILRRETSSNILVARGVKVCQLCLCNSIFVLG